MTTNQNPEPSVERITPQRAAVLLAMNVRNRNVRKAVVARYAEDMKAGRWHFNGAPILVGEDGVLYDGQHRLMAVVESRLAQDFVVIYGVSIEAKYTIDSGSGRKAGDILSFSGVNNGPAIAAIARLVMAIEQGRAFTGFRPSNIEIREWVLANPDIEVAADIYAASYRQVPSNPSVIGATYMICARIDREAARSFFVDRLINTEGLTATDPVKALRKRLSEILGRDQNAIKYEQVRYIFLAWNADREGRQLTKLQGPRGGWNRTNFPEPK